MSLSQGRSSNDVVTKNDESIVSGLVQEAVERSIQFTNASKRNGSVRFLHNIKNADFARRALWLAGGTGVPPSLPAAMGGCRVRSRPRASLRHRSPLRMSLELRIPSCAKSTRQPPSPRNCPLNASSPAPSCPFRSRDAKKHGPASALRVGTAAGSVLHRPLVTCRVVGAVDEASTSARPTHGPTKGTSGTHGGTEWPRWGRILGSHWTRRRPLRRFRRWRRRAGARRWRQWSGTLPIGGRWGRGPRTGGRRWWPYGPEEEVRIVWYGRGGTLHPLPPM